MAWLKTDDGEGMAPWVVDVGNEAYGAYQRLMSYSAQHLTDGVVPAAIAALIAADVDPQTGASRVLALLERAGKIHRNGHGGAVELLFYLEHNPSRAQVEADREKRDQRARKAADARWKGQR